MAPYAEALLYLVPVVVAGIVAFVVSRPDKTRPDHDSPDDGDRRPGHGSRRSGDVARRPDHDSRRPAAVELPAVPPQRRANDKPPTNVVAHPTLMHAALSTHLLAVSGPRVLPAGKHRTGAAQAASLAASVSAQHAAARLVSIRKPTRIPRRPVHRCPHKP